MELIVRLIDAAHCRSSHHRLALDALGLLTNRRAEGWRRMVLYYYKDYLRGAKVPDDEFKDFKNHVLHVGENCWGGAATFSGLWYAMFVDYLRGENWAQAVYSAGVMSHYFVDPMHPFHTAQSEAENNIHRAVEWSISKAFPQLREQLLATTGYPSVVVPREGDWLTEMVTSGARLANQYYDLLIEEYDFHRGKSDPPAGLNDACREAVCAVMGHATAGLARVLDRAFDESRVDPPPVPLALSTVLAGLEMPIQWVTKQLTDLAEREQVEAMYAELQQTGRVEQTLPEDDRAVRELHRVEVIEGGRSLSSPVVGNKKAATPPIKPRPLVAEAPPTGSTHGRSVSPSDERESGTTERSPGEGRATNGRGFMEAAPRAKERIDPPHVATPVSVPASENLTYRLTMSDSVERAPSVGPKTARRLEEWGIRTVAQLLEANPDGLAGQMGFRHITGDVLRDWQDQARLACSIPEIYGHDAQILVGSGFRRVEQVAGASEERLLEAALAFCRSTEGQRVLRSSSPPDRKEVANWVRWARQAGRSQHQRV